MTDRHSGLSRPQIYTDGGLLSPNPSRRGGTWAWCRVEADEVISQGCGIIWAHEMPDGTVNANQSEFWAVVEAFRSAVADGEYVSVYLDSDVTYSRWSADGRFGRKDIPDAWWAAMNAELRRHGGSSWFRLAGHPSVSRKGQDGKSDLERGYKLRKDGSAGAPVSQWNVYVDALCTEQASLGNIVLECRRLGDSEALQIVAEHGYTDGGIDRA